VRPEPPQALRFDHVVLTVRDVAATCDWYERVLGMRRVVFDGDATALAFGGQKINLQLSGHERGPYALRPAPGTADLCFVVGAAIATVVAYLVDQNVTIELGPVEQTGAQGPMRSIYLRDPDQNLVEIASYG
jgi:catechol 2,3-dioxygenase-like lactoylglutathione lyase family enzyme